MYRYGLSPEGVEELLAQQNYECAICSTTIAITSCNIDHDHGSKVVRGLLCTNCNLGLGHFRDDLVRLSEAMKYLQKDW